MEEPPEDCKGWMGRETIQVESCTWGGTSEVATYTVTQNAAPACVLRGGLRELIPGIISASRVGRESGGRTGSVDDVTGFGDQQQLFMSDAPQSALSFRALARSGARTLLRNRTRPFTPPGALPAKRECAHIPFANDELDV